MFPYQSLRFSNPKTGSNRPPRLAGTAHREPRGPVGQRADLARSLEQFGVGWVSWVILIPTVWKWNLQKNAWMDVNGMNHAENTESLGYPSIWNWNPTSRDTLPAKTRSLFFNVRPWWQTATPSSLRRRLSECRRPKAADLSTLWVRNPFRPNLGSSGFNRGWCSNSQDDLFKICTKNH